MFINKKKGEGSEEGLPSLVLVYYDGSSRLLLRGRGSGVGGQWRRSHRGVRGAESPGGRAGGAGRRDLTLILAFHLSLSHNHVE